MSKPIVRTLVKAASVAGLLALTLTSAPVRAEPVIVAATVAVEGETAVALIATTAAAAGLDRACRSGMDRCVGDTVQDGFKDAVKLVKPLIPKVTLPVKPPVLKIPRPKVKVSIPKVRVKISKPNWL